MASGPCESTTAERQGRLSFRSAALVVTLADMHRGVLR